jgi:hypothetical protein
LKVSQPVKDIFQYCFIFASYHRYLANHFVAAPEEGVEPVEGALNLLPLRLRRIAIVV